MKKLVFLILSFHICVLGLSQNKKETVYSLVKQKRTVEWYKKQSELWNIHTQQNPNDEAGWLNLYTANRMLKIYRAGVSPQGLDSLVQVIADKIPGTFEYHYIAYWNAGLRDLVKNQEHLRMAQQLGPDRIELHDDLMTYYMVIRDRANITNTANKWFESNDISAGIYTWCYNMLASVEDNAILITVGDNDTYPCWILQEAKGIKPNVDVINASLIMYQDYQSLYLKELGIPPFSPDTSKVKTWHQMQEAMIKHIRDNTDRPFYITIGAQNHLYSSFEEDMYIVGLVYKYSTEKFDNIAVIKRNYEKYYLLDYLKINLSNDISQGVIDGSNSNYLLSFITLYHHYIESEDGRANQIKSIILNIAKSTDQLDEIAPLL
ncbi:MAG: hypothetical protein JXR19_03495 [Bacteroidia bacterium]